MRGGAGVPAWPIFGFGVRNLRGVAGRGGGGPPPLRGLRWTPVPAILPRRTPGDPAHVRRACEIDLPPTCRFRSDSRIHRRHPLPRLQCAVFPEAAQLSRSGRGTWPRARTLALERLFPCDPAESVTNPSG